jgi:hypothetical protein
MPQRYRMNTSKSWADTEADLRKELALWGAKDYILVRGTPTDGAKPLRESQRFFETPEQATVDLTVRWSSGREFHLAYNLQARSVDNLRVLYKAVEAIRLNEVRGIDQVLRQYYAQLPAGPAARPKRSPYDVLNILPTASLDQAEASYKVLARLAHPDQGGSNEAMAELNDAIEQLRKGQTAL